MYELLLSPYKLGDLEIKNKIIMAPMTRNRSINNIPGDIVATYYSQRTEAGLIITEGTSPSQNGLGYPRIPGLFNEDHVIAWKKVTDSVHKKNGKIFVQLMHTGRVSHRHNMPLNSEILAPSAIPVTGKIYTDSNGLQSYPVPTEMNEKQIKMTIQEYVKSAQLAMSAGFDGVEIHAANGYLIDQFINKNSNKRTDIWGGSIENRIRFAMEIIQQVSTKIGKNKTGVRLSPYGVLNDMSSDINIENTFEKIATECNKLGILYLHLVDHSSMGAPEVPPSIKQKIRKAFNNTLILSGGYDANRAEIDLLEKNADLIAFGRPFISNPNLATKIKNKLQLIIADPSTYYTNGAIGYIDYL